MAAVLSIALPIIAIICFIIALLFGLRAFQLRSQRQSNPYGVGRQEARLSMRLDLLKAAGALLVGVLVLVGLLFTEPGAAGGAEPALIDAPPTATDTAVNPTPATAATVTATATPVTAVTTTPAQAEPTATASSATNTPTPPTATATPEPETAVVTSGVGVWLRADSDSEAEQIEWVLQGTELVLLDGLEEGDVYDWQQVRTPAGNSGWVATEFITYANQP